MAARGEAELKGVVPVLAGLGGDGGNAAPEASPSSMPGAALEGIFQGPYDAGRKRHPWYVFDRRGFLHRSVPAGRLGIDFDARRADGTQPLARYAIARIKMEVEWLVGDQPPAEVSIAVSDSKIVVDGVTYHRVLPSMTDGRKLDGHFQYLWYASVNTGATLSQSVQKDFWFTPDGKFRYTSDRETSFSAADGQLGGGSDIFLGGGGGPVSGTYRIEGASLVLTTATGKKARVTIYPWITKQGTLDDGGFYIDGELYLEEDD